MSAFVKAKRVLVALDPRRYEVQFLPVKLSDGHVAPLVWSCEDPVGYPTFEEAERIVNSYLQGPGEGVTRARWDSDCGDWEILDEEHRRGADREDFHADC